MKKKSEYAEKLKDPRWQKIRLQVFERDEWNCQCCHSEDDTLVVHHQYYEYGKEPWDYPLDSFITLCQECHEKEFLRKELEEDFIKILKQKGFFYEDLNEIATGLLHLEIHYPPEVTATFIRWLFENKELLKKLTDQYFDELKPNKGK